MRDELSKKLADKYSWFRVSDNDSQRSKNNPYRNIPFIEVGEGWYNLLDNLLQEIQDYYASKGISPDKIDIGISQIKEKFGGLRFYISDYEEETMDIIDKYEELSFEFCENCGADIDPDKKIRIFGWIKSYCNTCEDKFTGKSKINKINNVNNVDKE